ncbi:aldehyde dehydrogenase [Cryomorpha ignava]|uniref:Aldehyde dehydrogenase n=1 Tax=Cryomorpha ignava TaxID=101383 RepID=A0A7K3WKC8_9FLAO|nr:aldehyde dehydrogenase [Cryomorpha ignava]NEN22096.1 aldehyde dehydrogenase [Cryomorpha ignava]
MEQILNYINGTFLPAQSKGWIDNYNPSNGEVYSHIPDSDASDIEAAYQAAESAFPAWAGMSASDRFHYLMKIAKGISDNLEAYAAAESKDNGKPISLARAVDIPRAVSNFEFFAAAATQFASESHYTEGLGINYTLRRPLGVVGCISPWNLPLYLFSWKIAPALAAGNTVVAKPSEITPMTAYLLSKTVHEAGLPAGVLNIVHGLGAKAGDAMCRTEGIKAISFTGGTETGKKIVEVAGTRFKKLSLELGGKNPNLIFADCDFDDMLRTTLRSSFSNQGQICLCGSRILIEESIYDKFKSAFVEKVKAMKVGDPSLDKTKMGAVVSAGHKEKILGYIALAKEEGGTILCGGKSITMDGELSGGYYIEPTVIENLSQNCRTNQEEIFGPVVTIEPFKNDEDALKKANATVYGLASTIWTSDLKRAHKLAGEIHAGIVWVNCWLERDLRTPFGGVKNSGVGREGGFEAMKFFTEPKNVCIKYE